MAGTIRDGSMLARFSRAIYGANVDDAADRRSLISFASLPLWHIPLLGRHAARLHPWTRILHAISEHNLAQLSKSAVRVKGYKYQLFRCCISMPSIFELS